MTLISLLEARIDNEIVSRMMKSLHHEILKKNIVDIYYLFETVGMKKYGEDIFLHFDKEVDEDDPESIEEASFIMETGFNLYSRRRNIFLEFLFFFHKNSVKI